MIAHRLLSKLMPTVIQQALAERGRLLRLEAMPEKRMKVMAALTVADREMAKLDESAPVNALGRRKRRMSRATRAKLAAAQKAL